MANDENLDNGDKLKYGQRQRTGKDGTHIEHLSFVVLCLWSLVLP